jgi:CDP-diacylglycerol--inositol 3-phosphatidyltransferase
MKNKTTGDKSKNVYLYVPNLIGYLRVFLLFASVFYAFKNPWIFVVLYGSSELLDAFDGFAARYLNQSSRLGAVLDMVTDRVSSNILLLILAKLAIDQYIYIVIALAAIDYSSHYVAMYSSLYSNNESHKNISPDRPWILRFYSTNRPFLFLCCLFQETGLLSAYILATTEPQLSIIWYIFYLSLPLGILKQVINIIQLVDSAHQIVKRETTKQK